MLHSRAVPFEARRLRRLAPQGDGDGV